MRKEYVVDWSIPTVPNLCLPNLVLPNRFIQYCYSIGLCHHNSFRQIKTIIDDFKGFGTVDMNDKGRLYEYHRNSMYREVDCEGHLGVDKRRIKAQQMR